MRNPQRSGVASGNPQQKTPREEYCMDKNSETTDTKPAGKKDAPQAFREIAERGPTQANETYEKMNAATIEASEGHCHIGRE
jgi:hypothetical protein